MREQALHAALDEMTAWLDLASSQVAVFDATNSTEDRRNKLVCVSSPLGMESACRSMLLSSCVISEASHAACR